MRSFVGASLLLVAGCDRGDSVTFPVAEARASTTVTGERFHTNARCESCHVEIAAEWRNSLHRQAYTNAAFTRAYGLEPDPFCSDCHAPEARLTPDAHETPELQAAGVTCVTCHLSADGAVRATTASDRRAPHALRRTADFGGPAACASCHEFAFPSTERDHVQMMQTTQREHAESRWADVPCAECHMKRTPEAGHRPHDFSAFRSTEAMQRALSVRPERHGDVLALTVTTHQVGHAYPTGDLFRRLTLTAETESAKGEKRRVHRFLTRHFKSRRASNGLWFRTELADDRPGGAENPRGTVTAELELGALAKGRPIHWVVAYERVDHPDGDSEDRATVDSSILLAEGTIEP